MIPVRAIDYAFQRERRDVILSATTLNRRSHRRSQREGSITEDALPQALLHRPAIDPSACHRSLMLMERRDRPQDDEGEDRRRMHNRSPEMVLEG